MKRNQAARAGCVGARSAGAPLGPRQPGGRQRFGQRRPPGRPAQPSRVPRGAPSRGFDLFLAIEPWLAPVTASRVPSSPRRRPPAAPLRGRPWMHRRGPRSPRAARTRCVERPGFRRDRGRCACSRALLHTAVSCSALRRHAVLPARPPAEGHSGSPTFRHHRPSRVPFGHREGMLNPWPRPTHCPSSPKFDGRTATGSRVVGGGFHAAWAAEQSQQGSCGRQTPNSRRPGRDRKILPSSLSWREALAPARQQHGSLLQRTHVGGFFQHVRLSSESHR